MQVVRSLVEEYQENPNTVAFSRILERVDRLLLDTIWKYIRVRSYLEDVPFLDLYHSAIVGLGRAILTTLDDESPDEVQARIIMYVRNEIKTNYPLSPQHMDRYFERLDSEQACLRIESQRDSDETIEMSAQFSMLRDEYAEMIKTGYITLDEWNMFTEYYVNEDSYDVIGERRGHDDFHWAAWRVQCILERIQKYFEGYDI